MNPVGLPAAAAEERYAAAVTFPLGFEKVKILIFITLVGSPTIIVFNNFKSGRKNGIINFSD